VQIDGLQLTFLDIPAELTQEYNRWYDLDHMPEHVSKADVLTAKRYVAPRDLQELGGGGSTLTGGHPPYLTIYSLGGDDFAGDEAWAGWTTKDRGIIKAGRFWRSGAPAYVRRMRLAETFTRASVLVSDEAVPYLAHRGVIVALGHAPSAEQRDDAVRWWRDTHLVDLLAVEGVLAAMRFESIQDDEQDLLLHVFLLEDDPAVVMERFEAALRYSTPLGRYPAHGGVYESAAMLPYRLIAPLEYDFEW
jgi:hypothetical protein